MPGRSSGAEGLVLGKRWGGLGGVCAPADSLTTAMGQEAGRKQPVQMGAR